MTLIIGTILLFIMIWLGFSYMKKKEPFINKNITDYVDIIYYINLDHRTDRKKQILSELKKLDIPDDKIIRMPAVYNKSHGHLGCSKSHINVMEAFILSDYDTCIVLEDDFHWNREVIEINDDFAKLFDNNIQFDVCMLSGYEIEFQHTSYDFITKVFNAQTTSGYIVKKHFAPKLLENYKTGAKLLEDSYNRGFPNEPEYCVDQYWKKLQPMNNWYLFYPKLGKQRESYSDIQGGVIDSGV